MAIESGLTRHEPFSVVVNLWKPRASLNVDLSTVDTKSIASFTAKAKDQSTIQFLMEIIPSTVVGAFAIGEILQVLFFAILFAFGLLALGERGDGMLVLTSKGAAGVTGWLAMAAAPELEATKA